MSRYRVASIQFSWISTAGAWSGVCTTPGWGKCAPQGAPDASHLVRAEVVHDHYVAGAQPRPQDLIQEGVEDVAVPLRRAKARTADALDAAVTQALQSITTDNATAWFRHCGYALQQP